MRQALEPFSVWQMGMRFSSRRILIAAASAFTFLFLFYRWTGGESALSGRYSRELSLRRDAITSAFDHAWTGYSVHCMGHDALHPVSNTCDDDFGGWGASAIDTLSTAIMLGREDAVSQILRFISQLNYGEVKGGSSIQVFEVVIRHFAAMISAHDLLHGPFSAMAQEPRLRQRLYEQMVALGDILSCAFKTPSGVPRNWLNPVTCDVDEATTNAVAGTGTLILEFARLSNITHNDTYGQLAEKAESYLLNPSPPENQPYPGLLGTFVSVSDGALVNSKGSWGSLSDSFYEYLLKAYLYDSERYETYLQRWKIAADSTIRHASSHPFGRPDEVLIPYWEGQQQFNAMDSLSWFAGGNFILGGMVTDNKTLLDFGLAIADTAGALYASTATGLGPEFTHWTPDCGPGWAEQPCNASNSVRPSGGDGANFGLRPEALETWYYAWVATGQEKYRTWAWNMFLAIERVCKTESGYSAISDVNAANGGSKLDKQESFVFAEVFKYLYLIHADTTRDPWHVQDSRTGKRNSWVFNTEAHPLLVAGEPV